MRKLIIEWIFENDNYRKYMPLQLSEMSDDELMFAHNDVVEDLIHDS